MNDSSTSHRPPTNPPDPEALLQRFEDDWLKGTAPSLEQVLAAIPATPADARRRLLAELIKIDIEYRKRRAGPAGERPQLEDYFRGFPELQSASDLRDELIDADFRVRLLERDGPKPEHYADRFGLPLEPLRQRLGAIEHEAAEELGNAAPLPRPPAATPIVSVASLLEDLRAHGLLKLPQLNDVIKEDLQGRFAEPAALGRYLLDRDLLTPYQVNHLLQGRGGDLVLGHYQLLARLGAGSFSEVFKARHRAMNRVVALKVIRRELLVDIDPELIQRFYREIQAAGQLSHPHVVHAYDAGPAAGTHFLAMEYVEGTDLARLVQQSGPLAVAVACDYVRQAAAGLQHICERGLVHRDIKPSNLLMSGGAIKIADLGLASLQLNRAGRASTLTREGDVMGTADYIAPEQAVDPHAVDIRADLYSLGCTFYYLLGGRPPFPGGTFIQKVERHRWEQAEPLETIRPEVAPALAAIVRRLMAKAPEERFHTPEEVITALADPDAYAQGMPIGAMASSRSAGSRPGARRNKLPLVFLVAGSLLLVAGVTLLALFAASQRPHTQPHSLASSKLASPVATGKLTAISSLDRLTPESIPLEERKAAGGGDSQQLPPGLVAILGSSAPGQPEITGIAFSPDGKLLATGTSAGTIRLWDASNAAEIRAFAAHKPAVACVAFHPNGHLLASGGQDFFVRLWDPQTGKEVDALAGHRDTVRAVAFSSKGKYLASGAADHTIRLWNVASPKEARTLNGHELFITAIAFRPDEAALASASDDKTVRLWDLATGLQLERFLGHTNQVSGVAFSPDGKVLASCGWDNSIKLWTPGTNNFRNLTGHGSQVLSIAFDPEGKTLASGSYDGTVRLWDPASGFEIRSLQIAPPGRGFARQVIFSPEGRHLAIANSNGTVYIVRLAAPPKSTGKH